MSLRIVMSSMHYIYGGPLYCISSFLACSHVVPLLDTNNTLTIPYLTKVDKTLFMYI